MIATRVGCYQKLLLTAEFLFEFAIIHFDEGGAAMRTSVRHGAVAKIVDEVFEFGAGKGIIRFDGMAADGLGHGVFTEAHGVDFLAGGFEVVDEFEDEAARFGDFDKGRQRIEEESAFAKFAEAHAKARERGKNFAEEMGVARGEFDGFGQEEALGRSGPLFFHPVEHLLKKDAFVGGVLVEQDEAAIRFEENVEFADDADETKRDMEKRLGVGTGNWRGKRNRFARRREVTFGD